MNDEAFIRYSQDSSHRPCTAKIVDFDVFNKAGIDSFKKLEQIGWGAFCTLNEYIYPAMIKEFYSNLIFNADELKAISLMKGRKVELSQQFLVDVIGPQ